MDCLYVVPAYRNAEIGAEVMQAIARHAEAIGCATLEWQTPIWNINAARFYKKLGAGSSEKIRFCWTPKWENSRLTGKPAKMEARPRLDVE
jgi:GNAT superfamily N-acetyltransferase